MSAAADTTTGWRHHWEVLKESWAAETARRANLVQWKEADFLPAALEVVETPPNPLGRIILWAIMVFALLALVWSIVAKLDVVATAPGKVITSGRNKLVQAADAGTVREIHVRDGERVKKGQALVTLDPTNAGADQAQAAANLQAAEIDMARSNALLAALRGESWSFTPPEGTPEPLAATQRLLIRIPPFQKWAAGEVSTAFLVRSGRKSFIRNPPYRQLAMFSGNHLADSSSMFSGIWATDR